MTDDTATTTPEAASSTSPSQPDNNEAEHGTSSEGSGLSSMMRAVKHELEGEDMEVTVEDEGEKLVAKRYGESYTISTDGAVDGGGVLEDAIESRVEKIMGQDGGAVEPTTESESDSTQGTEIVEPDEETVGTEETAAEVEPETVPEDEAESEGDQDESAPNKPDEGNDAEPEALPEGTPGLFEASIEAGSFQNAMTSVNAIVDECRIHLCDDGLVIRAVDPANVAMIDETITDDAFKSYSTDCGEIGIYLDRMMDVVSIADDSETLVQLTLNPEIRKLEMQVGSVEYTLALIDPDSIRMEPDIPDLDWPAEVSIDSAEFERGIRAGDMVADHLEYIVDPDAQQFITTADGDTDDVHLELGEDDVKNASWGVADSLFSLDYLKDIRKPIPSGTTLRLEMGEEFPLMLSFTMADETVEVTYMLAPRIQSN